MKDKIIEVKNVSYEYEDGTKALDNINFNIRRGEKISFVGGNGSGKSTMFLCLNGILKPKSGKILYDGKEIDYSRKGLLHLRSNINIVFQEPDNQLFSSSVYEEISFGILNLGVCQEIAREKVENVINELDISPFRNKPTHFLSGGQKKRVSIADILVMEPDVIILDEPTSALDPKYNEVVNRIIDKFTDNGITVILSTHDMNQAFKWSDSVLVFMNGSLVKEGTPEEIFLDEILLKKANLLQPDVLKLFSNLCKKGYLDSNLKVPRNIDELEKYILDAQRRKNK